MKFVAFAVLLASAGCATDVEVDTYSCAKRASPLYIGPSERAYCSTTFVHTTPVIITGSAAYEFRDHDTSDDIGLGAITTGPIRYAEIVVRNSAGTIVQCGETSITGTFSLSLPQSATGHTIAIYSRGNSSNVKASVLNCPEENRPYSITGTVIPDAPKAMGTITAQADNDSTLEGGAFNIFDEIVESNIFLRSKVSNCATSFPGCTNFSVAPKVFAYWAKGFNPNNYYNQTSGLSFYIPGASRLFILGGNGGDILTSDTDHFDDSVVVHEYGHFLEDIYTETDSPGGSHSGNSLVDPRLAWGEGWGNFIQAAVLNNPRYRDSIGTPNISPPATSSYFFNLNLEEYRTGAGDNLCIAGSAVSGCDLSVFADEGVFREFAVTRFLWDAFDSADDGADNVDDTFDEIWAALTTTAGFRNPASEFRNTGLLNFIQDQILVGRTDWSAIRSAHSHPSDLAEYAQYVTEVGGCGRAYSMSPYQDPADNGSVATSHRLRNNDFFHFYNTSTRNVTLTLKVRTTNGAGPEQEPDVDLYLYNSRARYGNSADIIGASENYFDNNSATDQTETITASALPQGDYLINVKLFTGTITSNLNLGACPGSAPTCLKQGDRIPAGDDITYELEINGVDLCPQDPP